MKIFQLNKCFLALETFWLFSLISLWNPKDVHKKRKLLSRQININPNIHQAWGNSVLFSRYIDEACNKRERNENLYFFNLIWAMSNSTWMSVFMKSRFISVIQTVQTCFLNQSTDGLLLRNSQTFCPLEELPIIGNQ